MKKKNVYIAGPMTGIKDFNKPAFFDCSRDILCAGEIPLNPAILPIGLEQHEYMAICLQMVMIADAVIMLPGWECSLGAIAENALAEKLGKEIIYKFD
jgi:hypothetical protein